LAKLKKYDFGLGTHGFMAWHLSKGGSGSPSSAEVQIWGHTKVVSFTGKRINHALQTMYESVSAFFSIGSNQGGGCHHRTAGCRKVSPWPMDFQRLTAIRPNKVLAEVAYDLALAHIPLAR
jgi:hypothetical protein